MDNETVVAAESSPAPVMDVSRGPLVDITHEQRAEFRKTGELPKVEPKKTEEAAPSSEAKPEEAEAKPAGDSETPEKKQEIPKPKKQTAEERIAQLEATIEKIRKGKESKETPAAPSPAKPEPVQQKPSQEEPTPDDKNADGTPKYKTYEEYTKALARWEIRQELAEQKREQQLRDQAKAFETAKEQAEARYENFAEVVSPFATALNTDPAVYPVVRQMFLDSDVMADLLFTIGSNKEEQATFLKMAKENPAKAIRYIALTESLITQELEKEPVKEEPPAKPKTQAPKPPSEAGGRAAAPPDAEQAALASAGGKLTASVKAEFMRRQLAKLKS
jgi:hypothetical protein